MPHFRTTRGSLLIWLTRRLQSSQPSSLDPAPSEYHFSICPSPKFLVGRHAQKSRTGATKKGVNSRGSLWAGGSTDVYRMVAMHPWTPEDSEIHWGSFQGSEVHAFGGEPKCPRNAQSHQRPLPSPRHSITKRLMLLVTSTCASPGKYHV